MAKAPDAYRTISEAAEEVGVPAHVLRFWETRFSVLKPMKRAGDRRLYRPQDMATLRALKSLLHDQGYTIRGVQQLQRNGKLRGLTGGDAPVAAVTGRGVEAALARLEAVSAGLRAALAE